MIYRSSKSPLFSALRKMIVLSANDPESEPPIGLHKSSLSRRDFLKGVGGAAVILAFGNVPSRAESDTSPKIVIIGAGIAGLNAAYKLKRSGFASQVYEASSRIGGRVFTAKDVMGPGLTTEFGGEFIDSTHIEMIALAKEFGLELGDRKSESEKSLIPRAYFFGGKLRTENEVVEAIRPFIPKIKSDAESLPNSINFRSPGNAGILDNISLAQYFHNLGISGWLKDLLESAYITEFGLETEEQSSLNFITQVSTDLSEGLKIFGSSDERYVIKGGNSRIIEELTSRLPGQIQLSNQLEAINRNNNGFSLTFRNNGSVKDVRADIVVLAIPFSILRDIDLKLDLPAWKLKAINELGYGTNSKVMAGFSKKIWRDQGYIGEVFSDNDFQLAWDNSQTQGGESGGLTSFSGGKRGLDFGVGTVDFQSDKFLKGIEKIFPGTNSAKNGKNQRFHWPTYKYAKGSFSAYKPGQWTSIRGSEQETVGDLFFAGEHCSLDFQGFMNGAAESGKHAAEEILKRLK